jgi:hypothetical protein
MDGASAFMSAFAVAIGSKADTTIALQMSANDAERTLSNRIGRIRIETPEEDRTLLGQITWAPKARA